MTDLPTCAPAPCRSCPYRRDVPSGIWAAEEYQKLPLYDGETMDQLPALFYCHQQDGKLCAGWVGCHDTDHLLALRFQRVAPEVYDYVSPVPLFDSGAEAAAHGMAEIERPRLAARRSIARLSKAKGRLRRDR